MVACAFISLMHAAASGHSSLTGHAKRLHSSSRARSTPGEIVLYQGNYYTVLPQQQIDAILSAGCSAYRRRTILDGSLMPASPLFAATVK